jgi:glutaminase
VREAYEKFRSDTELAKNADYIPFLAQVDSRMFGVAVVSTDQPGLLNRRDQLFLLESINLQSLYAWPSPWKKLWSGPGF